MSVDNFDVLFAKSLSKGGGGSSTDNYNELSNKPQINGNALTGNKTGANLGLQDAITSESKLSSDLVDDTGAENLFVSSTEKSTWGGKQDPATTLSGYGITDAYTKTETGTQITNAIGALDVSSVGGSGKYISAISETDGKISATAETMDTTPTSGSEKAVTSGAVYTALASKQDALTTAQLAAANSGITAAKLTADEAALAEVVDAGAKNSAQTDSGSATQYAQIKCTVPAGTYKVSISSLSSDDTDATNCQIYFLNESRQNIVSSKGLINRGTGVVSNDITVSSDAGWVWIYASDSLSHSSGDTVSFSGAMCCTKAAWDISHAYVPYCPSMAEMYEMIQALQSGTRSAPALAKSEPEVEPETGEEELR